MTKSYWDLYYPNFTNLTPSAFAFFCNDKYLGDLDTLVELGCGNGRDGLYLSHSVKNYIGIDSSANAIAIFKQNIRQAQYQKKIKLYNADFSSFNFNKVEAEPDRIVFYSRFSYHSINYREADQLIDNLVSIDKKPWIFLMEVRTIYDDLYGVGKKIGRHEYFTDHYRRFIDPEELFIKLSSFFSIEYFELANGFASYENEDPKILRLCFKPKK